MLIFTAPPIIQISYTPDMGLFKYDLTHDMSNYIYKTENAYYKEYQKTHFTERNKKIEDACIKDYDILKNECVTYYSEIIGKYI